MSASKRGGLLLLTSITKLTCINLRVECTVDFQKIRERLIRYIKLSGVILIWMTNHNMMFYTIEI